MAEQLLFLSENLFSVAQFPGHTVSAEEEPSGYEAHQVGNGRRAPQYRWQASTANSESYIQTRCDELRAVNCLIIDRGHNLAGETVTLRASSNNWTDYNDIFSIVIPSVVGGSPSGAMGCVTSEGAWIKTFDPEAFYDYRVVIAAMGAGLVPQIVNLWLGLAFQPDEHLLTYPLQDHALRVIGEHTESPFGWRGRAHVATPKRGALTLKCPTETHYDAIEYQVMDLFANGYAAWVIWQRDNAPHKAMLVSHDGDSLEWARDMSWSPVLRYVTVPFHEEQVAA